MLDSVGIHHKAALSRFMFLDYVDSILGTGHVADSVRLSQLMRMYSGDIRTEMFLWTFKGVTRRIMPA